MMAAPPQTVDILAALEDVPARGSQRCRLARFLDNIPADTPGRDELVRLVETEHDRNANPYTLSVRKMAAVLSSPRIGFPTGYGPISAHRSGQCVCYR
jgi:hypothetical protein